MAIAVHARDRGQVSAEGVVLILGAGGIRSLLTYACVASGATVFVADIADERLAWHGDWEGPTLEILGFQIRLLRWPVRGGARRHDLRSQRVEGCPRWGAQKTEYAGRLGEGTLHEYDARTKVANVCARDLPVGIGLLAGRPSWDDIAPSVLPLLDLVDEELVPLGVGRSRLSKALFDPSATAARPANHGRVPAG
jgi:hypothetical protein